MGAMPAIPESTRSSIALRLIQHAKDNWPELGRPQVTSRAGFAYIAAALPGDDEPQPLFRLRYGGSAHSFGFALYSYATMRYEDSVLLTGSPVGTPQEALDTACTLYLADTDDEPAPGPLTDLRGQPLTWRLRTESTARPAYPEPAAIYTWEPPAITGCHKPRQEAFNYNETPSSQCSSSRDPYRSCRDQL